MQSKRKALVQRVGAVLERSANGDRRIELLKLGFQLLVDQQQRLQRAMDVAVATGHDPVDRGFIRSGIHRKSSNCARNKSSAPNLFPVDNVESSGGAGFQRE